MRSLVRSVSLACAHSQIDPRLLRLSGAISHILLTLLGRWSVRPSALCEYHAKPPSFRLLACAHAQPDPRLLRWSGAYPQNASERKAEARRGGL
eukprot:2729651-Prymnesium_polylepis.1